MNVVLNGERRPAADGTSLAAAVALVTSATTGVAAAVNGEVVRRSEWDSKVLADGDEIEVLTAVQGG